MCVRYAPGECNQIRATDMPIYNVFYSDNYID